MSKIVMTLSTITMPTAKTFCFFASTIKSKVISCSCVMQGMVWLWFATDARQAFWLFSARVLVKDQNIGSF
jgi:hypothetical protein